MISISPTQNVGSEKPRMLPAMMVRATARHPGQPGVQPERDADEHRHQHRGDRQLQRRRHALQDQPQRRLVEHEAAAEIAVQRVAEEQQVLLPQRLIEAERGDDARRARPGRPRARSGCRSDCRSRARRRTRSPTSPARRTTPGSAAGSARLSFGLPSLRAPISRRRRLAPSVGPSRLGV